MAKIKEKYKVVKGFYDSEDVLKSQPLGRHYHPNIDIGATRYPETQRDVTDSRINFLIEGGFIEAIEDEGESQEDNKQDKE